MRNSLTACKGISKLLLRVTNYPNWRLAMATAKKKTKKKATKKKAAKKASKKTKKKATKKAAKKKK